MVDSTTDSTVTLSWMTTPQPNGAVTNYDVQYRRASAPSFTALNFTGLTGTITGLTNDTAYEFMVAAVTLVGRGPFTSVVAQNTG